MTSAIVTLPDGRRARLTGPDRESVQAKIDELSGGSQSRPLDPGEYDPQSPEFQAKYGPAGTPLQNVAAGAGKAVVDLARGIGQRVGLVSDEDVAAAREQDAPLMATTAGKVGNFAGSVGAMVPATMIPGANTLAGAAVLGGAFGAAQPTLSGEETALNTALGAAGGAAGQYLGGKLGAFVSKKLAQRAASRASREANDAVRRATLQAGQAEGYVVPPSTVNPSVTNRAIESLSGKAQTQQAAAFRNQAVTNKLVRRELGLADDAPLTAETMNRVREQAGQVYEAVKQAGPIRADNRYLNELVLLSKQSDDIAKSFPKAKLGAAREITELQDAMMESQFSAEAALEFTKMLREQASGNLAFSVTDPAQKALGRSQRQAALVMERLVERNLQANGAGDLMNQFRQARSLIAKSYTVQHALNEGSGNVVASKLAAQLRKDAPLTGGIRTAAKFASAFPKATAEVSASPGVSAVDAMVGGVGGVTVNPALATLPLGRMAARSTLLSGPYQGAMLTSSGGAAGNTALRSLLLGSKVAPPAGAPLAVRIPADVNE